MFPCRYCLNIGKILGKNNIEMISDWVSFFKCISVYIFLRCIHNPLNITYNCSLSKKISREAYVFIIIIINIIIQSGYIIDAQNIFVNLLSKKIKREPSPTGDQT